MPHVPMLLTLTLVLMAGFLLFACGHEEEPPVDEPGEPEELEPPPEALRPDGTKVDLSARLDEFVVDGGSVASAIEKVGQALDCSVAFSDDALGRVESTSLTLKFEDVGVPTVLHVLTEPYGLVYRVHRGVLWILMPGEEPTEAGR